MISYNLSCSHGHEFEGWFQNRERFEDERDKKRIECPVCGDRKIQQALSAPNIATTRKREAAQVEQAVAFKQAVTAMRNQVKENCDYVGTEFADEARKIHYGDAEERGIYGETTLEEAETLVDEGIEVTPIPWMEEPSEH